MLIGCALSSMAWAGGFRGQVSFREQEKAEHVKALPVILSEASQCLKSDLARHREFVKKYGISAFYGDRSKFSKMSTAEKRATIASYGADPSLLEQMQPTSCVGLTRKCLGRGFTKAGQADVWKRINDYTIANGVDGTAMQDALQKLGWKIVYWNPDVAQSREFDREEQASHPDNKDHFWGYHEENWQSVSHRQKYYLNHVDDFRSLVNFGATVPAYIKTVPFFVGTSHMGYHVFPGTFGQIIEGHSTRAINDPRTLETSLFNPLGGGGPTEGEYRSGIIAVPPGY